MKQSTVIFGVLIFAFVVFVTMRGDLPSWLALFHAKAPAPTVQQPSTGGGIMGMIKTAADVAKVAAMFA